MLTHKQQLIIHDAIHSWNPYTERKIVTINGNRFNLIVTPISKCRAVEIVSCGRKYKCIEQNKEKDSPYAQRARQGEQITWIIPLDTKGTPWGRIINRVIEVDL